MYLLVAMFALAYAQQPAPTLDPSVLIDVFGTPPTTNRLEDGGGTGISGQIRDRTVTVTNRPFDDITVKPTESNEFTDKDGKACKCVPYYLCNTNDVGVDINNASVTGWGELDIRFGEDECQESVEKCCTDPKNVDEVVVPKPDPTRLRGCGYRNPKGLDFTIKGGNGDEAEFGEFPWVVALIDANNDSYSGVGVLIHPQVVMTAGHIAYKYPPSGLRVRAGEWDTQTTKERLPYQERLTQEIYVHKDFTSKNVFNDIALLRLDQPLELADHINVICLPDQGENFDNAKQCSTSGWGKDKFGLKGRYAVILKKVEQDMIAHKRCNELLKKTRLGPRFKLHTSFVCAGGEEGKDTCQGDGGAPLTCPIGDDRYKLTGLVAWGIGCGQRDVPAVFAAVPNYRVWVDEKMAEWGYDIKGYVV